MSGIDSLVSPDNVNIKSVEDLKEFIINNSKLWSIGLDFWATDDPNKFPTIEQVIDRFGSALNLKLDEKILKDILHGLDFSIWDWWKVKQELWLWFNRDDITNYHMFDLNNGDTQKLFWFYLHDLMNDLEFVEKINVKLAELTSENDGSELQDKDTRWGVTKLLVGRDSFR